MSGARKVLFGEKTPSVVELDFDKLLAQPFKIPVQTDNILQPGFPKSDPLAQKVQKELMDDILESLKKKDKEFENSYGPFEQSGSGFHFV